MSRNEKIVEGSKSYSKIFKKLYCTIFVVVVICSLFFCTNFADGKSNLSLREQVENVILLNDALKEKTKDISNWHYVETVKFYSWGAIDKDFYKNNKDKVHIDFEIDETFYLDDPNDFKYSAGEIMVKAHVLSKKQIKQIKVVYGENNKVIDKIKSIDIKNISDSEGKIYKLTNDSKDIFRKLIIKGSNWDGLPLSDNFLLKYNNNEGIFKNVLIKDFEFTKDGLTSYIDHVVDITAKVSSGEKRYLIKYNVEVNAENVYQEFQNYIKINDIDIVEIETPVIINDMKIAKDNYSRLRSNNDYSKTIKTLIYNHFDSEYYLDEKNISESELISEDHCLFSDNFKSKYLENGKIKKEYVLAFNYLGCNLDKQLFYMHVLFDASPCNEQTQLVHYTIDKNGLMDDMYIVDVDYMNYNHCADVPYNSLFTDTKYESGFVGLFNLNPFDDTEYGLEYYYGLSGTAIDIFRMHSVLPSIHRSNYVELVNDGEYISDYYERIIYVDEYFNDSIIRYEIIFKIDDLLRLNDYSCKKISERISDKKDDKFQKDDEGVKYFYKKTKTFDNNPNDFISIIANTNRNHRWNSLSISDSFFEKYGNTGIFITDYNNDDYYRWVKVNKIEKVADYKYIVEIEYDSKEYRFNCQFNVARNVLQDVIVKLI